MNTLKYKSDIWEKRKNKVLNVNHNVQALEENANGIWKNDIGKIQFVALSLAGVAEYDYCMSDKKAFVEHIQEMLAYVIQCCQAVSNGAEVKEGPRRSIAGALRSGYWGYFALAIGDESKLVKVIDEESMLFSLYNKKTIYSEEQDSIYNMIKAIEERNAEAFNSALNQRIVQIRKLSLDYYLCVDIWSLGLIRYAEMCDMKVSRNKYIEADLDFVGL